MKCRHTDRFFPVRNTGEGGDRSLWTVGECVGRHQGRCLTITLDQRVGWMSEDAARTKTTEFVEGTAT